MKQYHSIDGHIVHQPIYAFDKIDGSNIRCEWDRKKGLHKFGSRKVLLGADHPFLGQAEQLTQDTYSRDLNRIFRDQRWEFTTCYFEFAGPRSFAGLHEPEDEKSVTLFDVDVFKKGLLHPRDFVKIFAGEVPTAALLYQGNPTEEFILSVKNRTLEGMTFEGVVCKGDPLKKGYPPHMFKVKSIEWVQRVKARWGDDPARLADLL